MKKPQQAQYRTLRLALRRHHGTIAALARSLDPPVTAAAIHRWLAGKMVSPRIREAAEWWAAELALQQQNGKSAAYWREIISDIERRYRLFQPEGKAPRA
jgi:hypothetical protein